MRVAGGVLIGFSLAQVMVQEGIHTVGEGSGMGIQEFGIEPEESSSVGDRGRVARDEASGWGNLTLPVSFVERIRNIIEGVEAKMDGVGIKVERFGNSEQVRVYISCF